MVRDGEGILVLPRSVIREDEIPQVADPPLEELGELVATMTRSSPLWSGSSTRRIQASRMSSRPVGERASASCESSQGGNRPTTSVALAARAGIVTNAQRVHHCADPSPAADSETLQSIVVTGPELEQLDPARSSDCASTKGSSSRGAPQKPRIVDEFKRREAVDMVLLDDFSSIIGLE
ncbi:hypothetical protein GSI_03663 [Ganoderma sinense ZZ0214-1]|uniref:Uncharacterized protein n=1 Tax=Ganoderma sinense ZZ0214-1 TaxID=1077348 RepID=A0A2G8SJK9_9APHY|nr:hypothetical protein GSI_03663 [Ganoderma sinense ZZ0214-1]